jgi:hypothetical protein
VVADFSAFTFTQIEKDQVAVKGATGRQKTGKLKISVGYKDSIVSERQISYGGPGAVERAKWGGLDCRRIAIQTQNKGIAFGPSISGLDV